MPLVDLVFSDLFVAENIESSWYKSTPDSLNTTPIPPELAEELLGLRKRLLELGDKPAFRIDWPKEGGMRLRVERISIETGKTIHVCRRYRISGKSLPELGMPGAISDKLMQKDLREGLVVFLGKAGSGKTTTATTFITDRLRRNGGVCWTIECPIEIPIQGKHGLGWCYQTEVPDESQIGPAVRRLLRATPNIIFIGELLDGAAVREAIMASTSGHLVVATFHASDLLSGLARLARLAGEDFGSSALADGLRVAIHVSLHNAEPVKPLPGSGVAVPEVKGTGMPARILSVEPFWMNGELAEGLRTIVRGGDFHMLKSEVGRQQRVFLMSKLP